MKKLGSLFLIFTIVYTTIGVRINTHHCEIKKTTNYSIFDANNCCPKEVNKCPMHSHKDDCCSDKVNLIHLGQDIHFFPNEITPNQNLVALIYYGYIVKSPFLNRLQSKEIKGRAPPLHYQKENTQAVYQVFII